MNKILLLVFHSVLSDYLNRSFKTLCLLFVFSFIAVAAYAVPPSEWTPKETEWVDRARGLYQQQGLEFTDEQAQAAVDKMRKKSSAGIPCSEWTPKEKQLVEAIKKSYEKQGLPFTDEQAQIAVKKMREKIAQVTGNVAALQSLADGTIKGAVSSAPAPVKDGSDSSTVGEEQIAALIAKFPPKNGNLEIKRRKDGFDINGRPFIDSEGQIVSYAYDVVTGDITYVAKASNNYIIKIMRAGSTDEPVTIATASESRNGWEVVTVTGKKLRGYAFCPLPSGVLVSRESAAFRYDPGKGVKNIPISNGYMLAPLQRGNVGATGYVLVEKVDADGGSNKFNKLMSSFKALGSSLGITKKEDYALMNVENGKLYPLNIEAEGKTIHKHSECKKMNKYINECAKLTTFESLYNDYGRNLTHYFWRVNWVKTPSGPIAISLENNNTDIYVTELDSGNKVKVLSQMLGFSAFDTEQRGDGSVGILSYWAMKKYEIPDAIAHIRSAKETAKESNDAGDTKIEN